MYITPRVLISQEFTQIPVYSEFPLPAFIIGPNYALTRYSQPEEKPFTALTTYNGESVVDGNSYVYTVDTTYDFPNVPIGGNVDHSYTKVYAESVEAQYFPNDSLSSLSMTSSEVTLIASASGAPHSNKIRFSNAVLRTANGYNRSGCFSNRDVSVNDVVEVSDDLGNVVRSRIASIEADSYLNNMALAAQIAPVLLNATTGATTASAPGAAVGVFTDATIDFSEYDVVGQYLTIRHIKDSPGVFKIIAIGDTVHKLIVDRPFPETTSGRTWHIAGAYNDEANTPWECASYSNAPVETGTNTTVVVTNTSTAYVGYSSKAIVNDTYTATVTNAGSAALARFTITSANGAFAPQENVSLDSGVLVLDGNGNNNVELTFVNAEGLTMDFSLGDAWSVSVVALVEVVNPTTAGTYVGYSDMVYKLTVERGGAYYDGTNANTCARIIISSSDVDTSSVVLPRGVGHPFAVGSYGVTATFPSAVHDGGLIAGDIYYIPVKAAQAGPDNILNLTETLPQAMLSLASVITVKLFLRQAAIQIPEVRNIVEDTRNWTQEDSYITINAGITTYNIDLVAAGEPARLPVRVAKIFVEHRDLLQDYVNAIDSVRDLASVKQKLGVIHPDNPLAQGVNDAVLNAQGQVVYFIGVQTDDLAGYNQAIQISEKNDKVYSFVPMTFDRTVQDAVAAHVNAYSTPEVGRWRVAWFGVEDKKTAVIYDKLDNGAPYQATITDDNAVSGTQYRLVTIAGAKFIDDGVRPNDTIRINFRSNADGKLVYSEYVVDQVRTNTTLIITKPIASAISVPTKVQVIRNYTKSERATNIAFIGAEFNNRRVRCVFPDSYTYGTGAAKVTKQGYIAAAGLAGLRSGVVPHQGLTNSEFYGAQDLAKVVLEFSQDDLNTMAEQGIWLITQQVLGSTPYVRHQLTTDRSGLNTSEDSITTNVDNISYALKEALAPYIGKYNVNPENVQVIRAAVDNILRFKANSTYTVRAGNQLTSYSAATDILLIQKNPTFSDRIDVQVRLNVPYPLNYINLKLIV